MLCRSLFKKEFNGNLINMFLHFFFPFSAHIFFSSTYLLFIYFPPIHPPNHLHTTLDYLSIIYYLLIYHSSIYSITYLFINLLIIHFLTYLFVYRLMCRAIYYLSNLIKFKKHEKKHAIIIGVNDNKKYIKNLTLT
jgi:hypothetical protein